MNKKFLSAILFGALTAASTSTFVSCKDYDDDIDQLQMQIDQNASSAASDLAAKVAALESQISTLNAAKENLASQLAAAKTEAANAAAAALDAAKGAQSTADAANLALAEAAAKVAVLETKVSSLESIVADLQAAKTELSTKVADLQTQMAAVKNNVQANADAIAAANAKILANYTELSGKIAEVLTNLGARIDVIDATLNTIQANYATKDELNSKAVELAAMDAQLSAQIATNLKYIETLQATVKELAAKDTELAGKIEANYAELLGKINTMATEQAAALKDIQALQATVATLNSSYSTLASAKADVTYVNEVKDGLTKLIEQLSTSTNTYSQYIEDLRDRVSKLEQGAADLQKKVDAAATQESLNAAIADLQAQIKEAGAASDAALNEAIEEVKASVAANAEEIAALKEALATKADQSELDALAESLTLTQADVLNITEGLTQLKGEIALKNAELEGQIAAAEAAAKDYADQVAGGLDERLTDAEDLLAQLVNISGEDLSAFVTQDELTGKLDAYITSEEFAAEFEAQKTQVNEAIEEMTANYETFKSEIEEQIKAEVAKLTDVNEQLVTLKDAVELLKAKVDAIIKGIQSIVFVPQFSDVQIDVFTSYLAQYQYYKPTDSWYQTNPLLLGSDIKFRVQPTGMAATLAAAWAKDNSIIKLESSDALKDATRAAAQYMTVTAVRAEGDFLVVTAENKCRTEVVIPTTLVVTNETVVRDADEEAGTEQESVVIAKTSDYFNVQSGSISGSSVRLSANDMVKGTYVNDTDAKVGSDKGSATFEIKNTYFAEHPYSKYTTEVSSANSLISETADVKKISEDVSNEFFEVTATGVKVLPNADGYANPDAVGKTVTVTFADAAYGFGSDGSYYVQYDVTYKIVKDYCQLVYTIPDFGITWPDVTADAYKITVADIENANSGTLKSYNQTAANVFDLLCGAIGDDVRTIGGSNGCGINLAVVTDEATGEKYITAEPNVDLTGADYVGTSNKVSGRFTLGTNSDIILSLSSTINLSVPDASKFFIKQTNYWSGTGDVNAFVSYNASDLNNSKVHTYTLDMHELYKDKDNGWVSEGVGYTWTIDSYKEDNVVYTVQSGIAFNGSTLTISGPVELYNSDLKATIYRTPNDLTFTAKAAMGYTTLATNKNQGFEVVFPTDGKELVVTDVEHSASEFEASAVNVAKGVSFTDKDDHKWIVEGAFVSSGEDCWLTTWGYTNLKYEVVSAKIISTGEDIADSFTPQFKDSGVGELTILNAHNLTKDIEVVVKVSFDYNYQIGISNTFTVTVKAQ